MTKTLQEIRNRMNKIVESFNEAETGYDQVLEVCYADWGDWDGHDDSTEPEQPDYICYYLNDAGVGGFADHADFPEIYSNLRRIYIKKPDVMLTDDRANALKFTTLGLDYNAEADFCQDIADLLNANKIMGHDDWVANFKNA